MFPKSLMKACRFFKDADKENMTQLSRGKRTVELIQPLFLLSVK